MAGAITIPEQTPLAASAAGFLKRLKNWHGALNHETYRPMWAAEEALTEGREALDRLLTPAGWTATAGILDQVAALIPMPKDAEAVKGYAERLQEYPLDVLARGCESVVRSHLSHRPPTVGVFVKAINADHRYQTRLRMRTNLTAVERLPVDHRPKPTGAERERIAAGFGELIASL